MSSFWGRLKFVFSSVCQASMITFVGFLQRIPPYVNECQIFPYGSRTLSQFVIVLTQLKTVEISNFHFSHYKSMETLSCHSNQSSYPTGMKNITFVEGNVLCKYAKFQLHPPYDF